MSDSKEMRKAFLAGACVFAGGLLVDRVSKAANVGTLRRVAAVLVNGAWMLRKALVLPVEPEVAPLAAEEIEEEGAEPFVPPLPPPPPVPRGNTVFARTFEEMQAVEDLRKRQAERGSALEASTFLEV